MSQTFYYAHIGGAWTVNLGTQAARLGDYGGYSMKAETGAVGNSTVVIDDPTASVGHSGDAILGLQQFYVTESDCPPVGSNGIYGQRLYTSYTRERTYRRGTGSRTSLITGGAREIEMTLEDPNSAAAWRILYETTTPLSGSFSKAAGNTTITGVGTLFLSELGPYFTISIPGGGGTDVLHVASVASDTSLTVVTAPTYTASGQPGTRVDAARPAETDVQRVLWLLGGYISHPALHQLMPVTNDAGWVDTSNPVNMDAVDYTGQTPGDVLHDCALASGKDWWIGYWEATGNLSLWYAVTQTSLTYTSPLQLSNVLADVDQVTTFAPELDASMTRSPARTFSGIYEPYTGGNVYVSSATTASNYAWRDGSAPNSNRSTLASATADANRLLAQDSVEEDRITARVRLPSSKATGIKVGQRVRTKLSFLPPPYGSNYWYWRVASLGVQQDEQTDKRYTLSMELTPQAASAPTLVQAVASEDNTSPSTFLVLPNPPAQGDLLVLFLCNETGPGGGWTTIATTSSPDSVLAYRIAGAGESASIGHASVHASAVAEFSSAAGWSSPVDVSASAFSTPPPPVSSTPTVTLTPTGGRTAIVVAGFYLFNGNTPGPAYVSAGAGWTVAAHAGAESDATQHWGVALLYQSVTSTSGSYSPSATYNLGYMDPDVAYWTVIAASLNP